MPSYTDPFGGSSVNPADVQFREVALTASVDLGWPSVESTNYLARIMRVTPSGPGFTMDLPDARVVSEGQDTLFLNIGASSYTVRDTGGNTVVAVAPGEAQYVFLRDNATANGVWSTLQFGALASAIAAGSLAGYGLAANGATLRQAEVVSTFAVNTAVAVSDITKCFVWTGGVGTLTLLATGTAGSDFYVSVVNSGTGALLIQPTADTIDGAASITLQPSESAVVHSGGSGAWYTVGRGRNTQFSFTLLTKAVTTGNYNLTSNEASNVVQKYTGALVGNVTVTFPSAVQVYFVQNLTTNAFSLTFKTSGVGTTVALAQGQNAVLFCDGTNVVNASTTISGVTALSLLTGSAASPSLNWIADGTTGLFSAGGGQVSIASAGVQVASFRSAGLSVGTTSINTPAGSTYSLTVGGTNANISGAVAYQVNGTLRAYSYVDTLFAVLQGEAGVGVKLRTNAATDALTISSAGVSTFGGVALGVAGSVGAPSFSFVGDTDTGMYRVAANEIGFAQNGIERVRFLANGVQLMSTTGSGMGVSSDYDDLYTDSSAANSGISILNGGGGFSALMFGDFVSSVNAGVRWDIVNQRLELRAVAASRLTVAATEVATSVSLRVAGAVYGTLGVRQSGAYGGGGPNSSLDDFVIENSGNAGISILTPDANVAQIGFGDTASNIVGRLRYDHAVDQLQFIAGGTTTFYTTDSQVHYNVPFGYTTGAGGSVTQATSKSTTAVLNAVCGFVTMNNAALAADTIVSFQLTNSTVAAADLIICCHTSGGTTGAYTINGRPGTGLINFDVRNNTAGSLSEAVAIRFAVVKAVSA